MGTKTCAVHEKQASVAACKQCGKELCKSCVMVTPAGTFCSSECSILCREMKAQGGTGKKASGAGVKLGLILLLLAAGAYLIHVAPMTKGKPYDLLDVFLKKTQWP